MLLYRLASAFEKEEIDYAVVGGLAVALHGVVRSTIDLDIIIKFTLSNFIKVEKVLNELGLVANLPLVARDVFNYREEYIKNRNLIAWSFTNPAAPVEVVDIIITHDLKNMKRDTLRIGRHLVKVIGVTELIKMKKESNRPQDREDIKALMELKK